MKKLFVFFAVCFLCMLTAASITVNAQPSTDLNTYVLFAYDRLSFKGGNEVAGYGIVYGNIGVNNPAATNSTISLEFATSGFAYMADGYQAVGDHVRGDAGGSFYDLCANKLGTNFGAEIRDLGPVAFTLPIIPAASLPVFPFVPNRALTNTAADLTIAKGATYTFTTSPWRDVRIKDHAIVTFGPGTFDIRDMNIGKYVTINVDENTILQIDQTFQPNNNFQFGIGTNGGAKIYVGAYGLNWTKNTATNFSLNSEVHATYFSPTGWLDIGGKTELFGHFWARSISGGVNDNVYLPINPCLYCVIDPCWAPFSSTPIPDINGYVLFAYDELTFKGGNLADGWGIINGNIGVNYAGLSSTGYSLNYATTNSAWIGDGYQAVADNVSGGTGGSFYDLFTNGLDPGFASDIRNNGPVPCTFPIMATASLPDLGYTPGPARATFFASDLTIDGTYNFTTSLFHNVRINDNSIVTFGPGIFDMWNLSIGKNVTINVDENTILQIDVKFDPNDGLQFGIGTYGGAKIYVGAYGLDPLTDKATNFSYGAMIHASYFAPTGWLDLGGQNSLWGHFWAKKISSDTDNSIFCSSAWNYSPLGLTSHVVKGEGIRISIFPNPAKESFTIQINNSISQGSILTLQDLTGKEILHTALQLQEGVNNYPVSIAGISPGVYVVRLQTGTGIGQTKLIITR